MSLPVNAWNTANVGALDNPTFCNRMCYNVPIMHPTPYNELNHVYLDTKTMSLVHIVPSKNSIWEVVSQFSGDFE